MKPMNKIGAALLSLISLFGLFVAQASYADTPSVTIGGFSIQPTSLEYGQANTLNYNFNLSTPSTTATKDYCSRTYNLANGDLNWEIKENSSVQVVATGTISADDFLGSLKVSKSGTFSFTPQASQTAANFQLEVDCHGTVTVSQITQSAIVSANVTGQSSGAVQITFSSDKTNQQVQPNTTVPVTFEFDLLAQQSNLQSACTNTSTLTYAIYEFSAGSPNNRSNQIFASNVSFSSFGTGSSVKNSIPLQVAIPGNDVGFVGQARCSTTTLGVVHTTVLGESSQITIRAGGSGSGLGGNGSSSGSGTGTGTTGATQNQNYSFQITNPLNGGPNTIFDVIDVVSRFLLQLSVPIGVLAILYAGFLFLTAGPKPARVEQAKKILTYTVIGLAIIFIGRGFITLIFSILQLGTTAPPSTQSQTQSQNQTQPQTPGQSQSQVDVGPRLCVNGTCLNGTVGPCQTDADCTPSTTVQQYVNSLVITSQTNSSLAPVNQPAVVDLEVQDPVSTSQIYNWSVVGGSLPPGMSLSPSSTATTGSISGTPTKTGNYKITVQGMDIANKRYGRLTVQIQVQ